MTKKEILKALEETERQIEKAAGLVLFRLEEERETLAWLLLKKG